MFYTAARKMRLGATKENETPDMMKNTYQAIAAARDSLRHRGEAQNMRALDDEMNDVTRKNDEERLTIQELVKRRRIAEKWRRLAETQFSYRNTLEKMIRDAMHQSVVYKEQVRLNQAASSALMARLEAQKAICDGSERELHKKFKEREELENQVKPESEKARKRSRFWLNDEDELLQDDDRDRKLSLYLPGTSDEMSSHKELRVYFEEEHNAAAAASEAETRTKHGEIEEEEQESSEVSLVALEDDKTIAEKVHVEEGKRGSSRSFRAFPVFKEPESEEDEESTRERGKGKVEKWLHILLENNSKNDLQSEGSKKNIDEMIGKLDHKFPFLEKVEEEEADLNKANTSKVETRTESCRRSRKSFDLKNTPEKSGRDKEIKRSESARALRRVPSSPSLIFGMKKGMECIRKKQVVSGNDDENEYLVKNNFIKSSLQTIKRVVKF